MNQTLEKPVYKTVYIDDQEFREITFPDYSKIEFSPAQAELYNDESDLVFLNAGRFYGKDHVLLLKAIVRLYGLFFSRIIDTKWERTGPIASMIFLSPQESNSIDLWERLIDFLPKIPGIAQNGKPNVHIKVDARRIEIFGGQIVIDFETSTRKDGLRSRGTDILYINEASYHQKQTLIDAIFPCCLRANYAGIIYMSSSAKGAGHWWDEAVSELMHNKGYFHKVGFKLFTGNLYDNPRTSQTEINNLKAWKESNIYSARRELLGWVNVPVVSDFFLGAGQSLAFDGERIAGAMLTEPINHKSPYVIGIDLATTGSDKLCVCVIDAHGVIVKLEKHDKTQLQDIIDIIVRLNNQFRPISIVYDSNMGVLKNTKNGQLSVCPLKPINMTNQKKIELVEHLQHHLIIKSIRIPHPEFYYKLIDPPLYMVSNLYLLLKEIHEYIKFNMKREYQTRGKIETAYDVTYHKGIDGTDDMLDSLLFAASAIRVPYKLANLPDNSNVSQGVTPDESSIKKQQYQTVFKSTNKNNLFGGGQRRSLGF